MEIHTTPKQTKEEEENQKNEKLKKKWYLCKTLTNQTIF